MTQSITLWGATYGTVDTLQLPKTGSGTASFIDTTISSNAAAASDITSGKQAWVNGSLLTGTNSGGGGGSALTLLATKSLGTISTTSTQATDTGQTLSITGFDAYDLLICICHTSTHTNNRHVATVRLLSFAATANVSSKTGVVIASSTQHYKLSSGVLSERTGTTPYGVYVNSGSIYTSGTRTLTLTVYQRYNSTSTGTINGTYVLDVYGVKLQSYL